ncbi:metallophosphoesterase family protein [Lysobacter brunescens]|uniref:Phosphoesterase n=1 Tax=Lysobacter brunescens TaxID=262323 RepID=A0ABW2YEH1_9GAMM
MPRIGVISDTHGLLRPEAITALQGCDAILHAGDIGAAEILAQLATLAPTTAVRGNNDKDAWASDLPEREWIDIRGVLIHLLHDIADLDVDPVASGVHVIVTGHSHRPHIEQRAGILHLNPGSAGPRRFKLPVTVAILEIEQGRASARIVELDIGK